MSTKEPNSKDISAVDNLKNIEEIAKEQNSSLQRFAEPVAMAAAGNIFMSASAATSDKGAMSTWGGAPNMVVPTPKMPENSIDAPFVIGETGSEEIRINDGALEYVIEPFP